MRAWWADSGVSGRSLVGPFALYLAGVALLGGWIIDDAGISFAYARNAAFGHGFVSQPGRPPVEGFSNFLWVVILAPLCALRLFDPVVTPKVVGAMFVLGSFAIVQRALGQRTKSGTPRLAATLMLAASPPIVIWTASGLENGLTLLLLSWLFVEGVERRPHVGLRAGAITALLAMTHPDGLVYAAFGPVLALQDSGLFLARSRSRSRSRSPDPESREREREREREEGSPGREDAGAARTMAEYGVGLGGLFGAFLVFRKAVFGLPMPHTYYAKRSYPSIEDRLAEMASHPEAVLTKLLSLTRGIFGAPGPYLAGGICVVAGVLLARRRLPREAATALILAAIGTLGYLVMDDDWMGEYRFATGPVLFWVLALVTVATAAFRALRREDEQSASQAESANPGVGILLAGLTLTSIGLFFPRIVAFAEKPTTPFADVERSFAVKMDAYADRLGIGRGSVLLADVGAPLFSSRLTVYDAAGLCEPDVIRTLKENKHVWLYEHPAFYEWVFEEIRPTFIATHHFWTLVTALEKDPRFARDYVAIDAYEDAYVKRVYGRSLRSGDFVRRDALSDYSRLQVLRNDYHPPPRPDPFFVRLREALFGVPFGIGAAPSLTGTLPAARESAPGAAPSLTGTLPAARESAPGAAPSLTGTLPAAGESAPAPSPSVTDDAIEALREEARRALYEKDDPNRAATLLGRLLEQRPSDADALFEYARALDSAIRPEEARPVWTRLLDLPPRTAYGAAARLRLSGTLRPAMGLQ